LDGGIKMNTKYNLAQLILMGKLNSDNVTVDQLKLLGSKNIVDISQFDLDNLADDILAEELDKAFKSANHHG
jgi:hypothetical protein